MEGNIVLAVTEIRANRLVIDSSVSPSDFVDKVKEVLYEYRYVDNIYRDMVTMDVVRANLGRLYFISSLIKRNIPEIVFNLDK